MRRRRLREKVVVILLGVIEGDAAVGDLVRIEKRSL
jgi:hypothetical protein